MLIYLSLKCLVFSMHIRSRKERCWDLNRPSGMWVCEYIITALSHFKCRVWYICIQNLMYILLSQKRWMFPSIASGEKKLYSGMSSAVTSASSGQCSETPELVTLELLLRCSLQSTFFGYDRIFIASRFGRRRSLVAAEVQNLLAAQKLGPAWGSHFPVSAPLLIGEKNYMVKNAAV